MGILPKGQSPDNSCIASVRRHVYLYEFFTLTECIFIPF